MTTNHVRFALRDVTFGGVNLPGATVDCWDELTGRTADGRSLSGHAVVADRQVGAGGRRETLVELHGSGDLHGMVAPTD